MTNVNQFKIKEIDNLLCGTNGCTRPANRRVFFSLGFCANFCEECANALTRENIGIVEDVGIE